MVKQDWVFIREDGSIVDEETSSNLLAWVQTRSRTIEDASQRLMSLSSWSGCSYVPMSVANEYREKLQKSGVFFEEDNHKGAL